jgi:hypothetical protein
MAPVSLGYIQPNATGTMPIFRSTWTSTYRRISKNGSSTLVISQLNLSHLGVDQNERIWGSFNRLSIATQGFTITDVETYMFVQNS